MDIGSSKISFICTNTIQNFMHGKLELPTSFASQIGSFIPRNVSVYVNSGRSWSATIDAKVKYIEGLEDLMDFYLIKPYHPVRLHYDGSSNFLIEIYNPYAIEINYHGDRVINAGITNGSSVSKEVESDMLRSTFCRNAMDNTVSLYELVIETKHLAGDEFVAVSIFF
ncbi:uncharacterized protein LOC141674855 [Apium graveolens]|uniref:uncharacterized protein LOC141674855 n=1 Tax=Apium graveolens TaxID=4045 RepID=UPI003D79ECE7